MSESANILIVDDKPEIRNILRKIYVDAGYGVAEAGSADEARALLASQQFQLVTVDLYLDPRDLQKADGIPLAREIRQTHNCGIILVSVMEDSAKRNDLLSQVADDNILKPFMPDEVLARTRAVLRRYNGSHVNNSTGPSAGHTVATFAGWTLNVRRHEVTSPKGTLVTLTAGEFNLLRHFAEHPNEVLSREQIVAIDASIQTISTPDRAVDMRISRLRHRLGQEQPEAIDLIRTVRGTGYRLVADVVWSKNETS